MSGFIRKHKHPQNEKSLIKSLFTVMGTEGSRGEGPRRLLTTGTFSKSQS